MALNPDDQNPPIDGSDSGSGSGSSSGGGSGGTSGGTGSATGGSGTSWNTALASFAGNIFGAAAESGQLKIEIDPAKPLTANTRYNETTDKIEVFVGGKWVPVTVVLVNNTQKIDLSQYTQKEIYDYMQSGLPIPAIRPDTGKKVSADTVTMTDTTTTKSKWWVWVLVAVGVGGGLFLVWKLAKKRSARVSA